MHIFLDRLPVGGWHGYAYFAPIGAKPPEPEEPQWSRHHFGRRRNLIWYTGRNERRQVNTRRAGRIRPVEPTLQTADFDALERELTLYAYVPGWAGDPLHQPARVVGNIARRVVYEPTP
jgi:hypothetical protein